MKEIISQAQIEDAIDATASFVSQERDTGIDGGFASQQIAANIQSKAQIAEELLTETPHPSQDGWYAPLHKLNVHRRYAEAVTSLPGYIVLVPSAIIDREASSFYPAVISEDSLTAGALRLHVLRQPYRLQLLDSAKTILSGAGQSETTGIGNHGRTDNDGVEAEHFTALLASAADKDIQSQWSIGNHVNHAWRSNSGSSVTGKMYERILSDEIAQKTITVTRQSISKGKAAIYWHDSLRAEDGRPEGATTENALVVIQAIGFQALRDMSPRSIDTIKRLLA